MEFLKTLQDIANDPMFLGGIGMMSGGPQAMMQGMKFGNQMQDKARRRQALEQGLGSLPGLQPNERAMLVENPELAQGVLAQIYRDRYDPMSGLRRKTAEAELSMFPLDRQFKQAQIRALQDKGGIDEMFAKLLSEPQPQPSPPQSPVQPQSYQGAPANRLLQQISDTTQPQPAPRDPNVRLAADETADPTGDTAENAGSPAVPNAGAVYSLPGNETVQTPLGPMTRDKARRLGAFAALKGKGDFGKMLMDAASGGGGRLSKGVTTANDKDEIASTNQVATLNTIKQNYDAKYLNIGNRIKLWGTALADKLGTISPKDKQDLQGYATFRQSSWHNLNRVLKDLSGTAVTENEMKRQLLDMPNPGQGVFDGDNPADFEAKLNGSIRFAHAAIARSRFLRSQGFTGKPWEAGVSIEDMPGIINKRGTEIEGQLRQQMPNANPMQLQQAVKRKIKQEFGI